MRWSIKDYDNAYKDDFLSILKKYGKIEDMRKFQIDIQWKDKKYPTIISDYTKIDLVDILRKHTWYSFFFFEDENFYWKMPLGTPRKKEIYYNKNELDHAGFLLSLLHEVGHFPIHHDKDILQEEKDAWIKAMELARIFKNTYDVCFLAGFKNHGSVYNYTKKFIKTYEKDK